MSVRTRSMACIVTFRWSGVCEDAQRYLLKQ